MRHIERWLILFLLTGSAVAASAAHAQEPPPHLAEHDLSVQITAPDAPLQPIQGLATVPIVVTVTCKGVENRVEPHVVHFEVAPGTDWAVVTIDKLTAFVSFPPQDCLVGTQATLGLNATVALTADAPAGFKSKVAFLATMDSGEELMEEFEVQAGFYERWDARFERNLVQAPLSGNGMLALTIENLGNGPIRVDTKLNEQTSRMLIIALPGQHIVDSPVSGQHNLITIPIDFRSPDEARRDVVVLDISGQDVTSTSGLTPIEVSAVVETSGSRVVEQLPHGMAPLLALGLLLVAGLRRR